MGIKAFLQDAAGNLLGASWAAPIRVALFGRGAGDFHSPYDFTATRTGDNQLTLTGSGLPTITNTSQFRAVRAYDVSGRLVAEFYNSGRTGFYWDSLNAVLTVGGVRFSPAASSFEVELQAQHRGYSLTEASWQSYQVNPEHAWTAQNTNSATGQGNGTTYYYYDADTYKFWGVQIIDTPGAAGDQAYTVEASWQDDGTAQAACAYTDITQPWWGFPSVTSAQITANAYAGILEAQLPLTCKYIRIKIVRANDGGGTDGAWDIYGRMTY
jgi:hypothetical protein